MKLDPYCLTLACLFDLKSLKEKISGHMRSAIDDLLVTSIQCIHMCIHSRTHPYDQLRESLIDVSLECIVADN